MNFFFYSDIPNQANEHLIHTDSCKSLPEVAGRSLIGKAASYQEALTIIERQCPEKNFSSCKHCCLT